MSSNAEPLTAVPEAPRMEKKKSSRTLLRSRSSLGGYTLCGKLGEGSFGKVRLATKVIDGKKMKFAVKEVDGCCEALKHELDMQVACHNHPNIPTVYDFIKSGEKTFAVMEYGECGDLLTAIRDNGPLTVPCARKVMRQLVAAVEHMHSLGIAHCDIKPENVIIADNGSRVMLCDFGLACPCKADDKRTKRFGTTRCMAPEMLSKNEESGCVQFNPFAADIFALGNLMFVLLTGGFPFATSSQNETMRNIVDGKFVLSLSKQLPADVRHLVHWMLQRDSGRRASIRQVKRHRFFAEKMFASNRSC